MGGLYYYSVGTCNNNNFNCLRQEIMNVEVDDDFDDDDDKIKVKIVSY